MIPLYGEGSEGCYRTLLYEQALVICGTEVIREPEFEQWVEISSTNGGGWVRSEKGFFPEHQLISVLVGNMLDQTLPIKTKLQMVDAFLQIGGNINAYEGKYGVSMWEIKDRGLLRALQSRGLKH
ncbi:MAG: hypothetical protein ACOY3V_03225 [Pseudomonadota bacterium]